MITFKGQPVSIVNTGTKTTRIRVIGSEYDSAEGVRFVEYTLSHKHHKGSLFIDGVCIL